MEQRVYHYWLCDPRLSVRYFINRLFAGGSYYDIFPLRGPVSANFDTLPWYQKITDYLWHITLPVLATVIGGFAALTMLTKNSFLDEVRKQYVVTARAKGVSEKHSLETCFRNAMLLVIAGFPATFISMFSPARC